MLQRPPTAGLDPYSDRWPPSRRAAVGALAFAPTVLLAMTLIGGLATTVLGAAMGPVAVLFYVHVISQFLIVLLFSHFALTHPTLREAGSSWVWVASFMLAAPVAVPTFWWVHVRAAALRDAPGEMRAVSIGTDTAPELRPAHI